MFSTGQISEGAVNYTSSAAVCGETTNGDNPSIANNRTNLTLPQVQACAAPIGPKWVSAITNWLCYVIDGAGLQYASGQVCQDPLLLLNAIIALIHQYGGNVIMGPPLQVPAISPAAYTPPSDSLGSDGMYYVEDFTETVWGPKSGGHWPASPKLYGKGKGIGVSVGGTTINFYNALVEIISTVVSTLTTTMPTPQQGNGDADWMRIYNASSVNQVLQTPAGEFYGFITGQITGSATITLAPGQSITIVTDATDWIVTDNNMSFKDICAFAIYASEPPSDATTVIGCDPTDGHLIKFPVSSIGGGGGGGDDDFNPFTATGVGAVIITSPVVTTPGRLSYGGATFTWSGTGGTIAASISSSLCQARDQRYLSSAPAGSWKVQTATYTDRVCDGTTGECALAETLTTIRVS